ncbi:hypothetical protein EOD39_3976 [Acipenser ruthenus]|uniref:Uncharacterized protein n=1 Tax=Acipenser ruthenus TaxID=7906 RepID=A0A444UKB7_ACIRT|nr:hypothetical protein EOD39_3976 [Acipenser ruthenus]
MFATWLLKPGIIFKQPHYKMHGKKLQLCPGDNTGEDNSGEGESVNNQQHVIEEVTQEAMEKWIHRDSDKPGYLILEDEDIVTLVTDNDASGGTELEDRDSDSEERPGVSQGKQWSVSKRD